jgi:hypothetical protein
MRLILVATLVICTFHQPLPACINDSATKADEQQFASGYGDNSKQHKRAPPADRFHPGMLILLIPSLAMLGVGFFWLRQERLLVAKRQQRMLRQTEG